jgi:hypothetical protein
MYGSWLQAFDDMKEALVEQTDEEWQKTSCQVSLGMHVHIQSCSGR